MSFTYDTIGFIGVGNMGQHMADNLLQKLEGLRLYVHDVCRGPVDTLCSKYPERVVACANAKEVAEHSSLVFSMVPEGSHVRAVYLDPSTGILVADCSNKILIDCSTIDAATSLTVREQMRSLYPTASFYDAPVSGGVLGAQRATLTFMLGCSPTDGNMALLRDLLGKMGSNMFACGGPSLGLIAKACNNYCSGLIAIATSEAMNIGMAAGMDPRLLKHIFDSSTAQSTILDKWCPVPGILPEVPSSNGYRGGFKVQLMRKDFGLAVDTAKRLGVRLALGDVGLETYTAATKDARCRDLDSRVVYRFLGGNEDWEKDFEKVD